MGVNSGKYFISSVENRWLCVSLVTVMVKAETHSFNALFPEWWSSWLQGSLDTEIRNQTMHPSLRGIVEKCGCTLNNVCYSFPFYFLQASDPCFILVFRNYKHLFLLACKASLMSATSSFCSEPISYFQDQLSHWFSWDKMPWRWRRE